MSTPQGLWALALTVFLSGCSGGPERFKAPSVDAESAAAQALELYDANHDGALNEEELAKVPAMLAKIKIYDVNANKSIEQDEIEGHLGRMLNRTGGTPLTAMVYYRGSKLAGAMVELDPEPYLGGEVQAATGVTNGAGLAELSIPPEYMPEHLRRLKMVHYGVFKVRITHPTISIPAKYNTETELGYETEPGNPHVTFALDDK
jgi:hypothetical protein